MRGWRIVAVALAAAGLPAQSPAPWPVYAEEQVWEYRARPGDEGSLLRIQKIEELAAFAKVGPVYHISAVGVHYHGMPLTGELRHAPVSRQTLDASVTRLSSSHVQFPSATDGIAEWRAARGGVFTIPVADIVAAVERAVPRGGGVGGH